MPSNWLRSKIKTLLQQWIRTGSILLLVIFILTITLIGCNSLGFPLPGTPVIETAAETSTPIIATASPSSMPTVVPTATVANLVPVPPDRLRGQIIRFGHPWSGEVNKAADRLIESFNLSNPWGIIIVSVAYPGYDALHSEMMTDSRPEQGLQVAAGLMHQALQWEQTWKILDLWPYILDPNWGLKNDEMADYYPWVWNEKPNNGRQLGFPIYRSSQLMLYNQSWGKELGFSSPPETPELFRQQACAAAQAYLKDDSTENDGTGGWIISTDPSSSLNWIYSFGGEILKAAPSGGDDSVYQFHTAGAEQAFTTLRELNDLGCTVLVQDQPPASAFAGRMGLFATVSAVELREAAADFSQAVNSDDWVVIAYPSVEKNTPLDIYGPDFFIQETTPEQTLASWLFVRWMSQPENSARLIEAGGLLPVRASVAANMQDFTKRYPQWLTALELLENARQEPPYASWGAVRRALGDATTQVFRSYFTVEQVPALLDYLDIFAAELHLGPDMEEILPLETTTPELSKPMSITLSPAIISKPEE